MKSKLYFSIHIYYRFDLDVLLVELIEPMIDEWSSKGFVMDYFFIRYWEGGQHIRLRLNLKELAQQETIVESLQAAYNKKFVNTQKFDDRFKVVEVEYIPELHRYGGAESIAIAEKVFKNTSKTTLHLLKLNNDSWDYSKAISFAMQMHLLFIKAISEDIYEAVDFLRFLFENYLIYSIKESDLTDYLGVVKRNMVYFNSSYDRQKHVVDYICASMWCQSKWEEGDWRNNWFHSAGRYIEKIKYLENQGALEEPQWLQELVCAEDAKKRLLQWGILTSYFHIVNNCLGILLRDESYIYLCLIRGLESQINNQYKY